MEAPISPPEPPKREIVRVTKAIIKEKPSAFSSVGSAGKDGAGGADGALNAAVFKRFHSSAPGAKVEGGHVEAGEDGDLGFGGSGDAPRLDVESRRDLRSKRKSPFGARPTMLVLHFSQIVPTFPLLPVCHSMMTVNIGLSRQRRARERRQGQTCVGARRRPEAAAGE
jgi:hypothetical protein